MKRRYWLALAHVLACEDSHPSPARPAASVASSTAQPPLSELPTGTAAKLDATPSPVVPERRLRQLKVGKALVIDTKGKWAPDCLIHRTCEVTPRELPRCAAKQDAAPWPTLPGKAEHYTDPNVAIKGRLVMDDSAFSSAVACAPGQCCNGRRANMALAGPPYDLELVGLGCSGDESRLCCDLAADVEPVIASGQLRYERGRLLLDSPQLCRVVE